MENEVTPNLMQSIHEQVKTPFKYGIVLQPPSDIFFDCPSVFRFGNLWYMLYVSITNKIGYETHLASSTDLLHWEPLGKILPFRDTGGDCWEADGGIAVADFNWNGSSELQNFDNKYWLSYLGGALQGYETDPLSIGIAYADNPTKPREWTRLPNNPVLAPSDTD